MKNRFITSLALAGVLGFGGIASAQQNVSTNEPVVVQHASTTFDGDQIAKEARKALGDPAQFNFESAVVESLEVSGGKVQADITRNDDKATVQIHGRTVLGVRARGHGDRNSPLDIEFSLEALDATVSLADRHAEVEAELRVINRESCRIWTRAKSHKTSPWTRITWRVTAIPRLFDFRLKVKLDVVVKEDGTIVLTPKSWRPANAEDQISIKISGQNLPDGNAVIKPLDAETFRVDMDIPFGIGDRTIANPLKTNLDKLMGREFVLGQVPN